MEQWVYHFKDAIRHSIKELVDIQYQRLEVEKEQTELLRQILEQLNK